MTNPRIAIGHDYITQRGGAVHAIWGTLLITLTAAIISVPTAVTGWFGQNVPYPGFQAHSGLVMSVVITVALSGGLYAIFRHNDWL